MDHEWHRVQPATKTEPGTILYSKDSLMGRQEMWAKIPILGGRYVAVPIKSRPTDALLIPKQLLSANMPLGTYVTSRKTGPPVASREGAKGAALILHVSDGRTYVARRMAERMQMFYLLVSQADVRPRLNMRPIALRIIHQRFARNFMIALATQWQPPRGCGSEGEGIMRLIGIAAISAALLLSGCGVAAKIDARQSYRRAVTTYQECLSAHQSDVAGCAADKDSMDAARQEYEEMSAGLTPGAIRALSVGATSPGP